ncbi:MAG: DNA-deoxyinosine glycosylase [Clostridium sp.]|nr:DNA-deoxyinosine glycosylase [Clostridium sp.]MCM1444447.1 DNA-deoxyinosine glycosylase [Candidatus Amulumruptor caecigallinarius]
MQRITHPFKPIYNKNSKILILGSFPSVKSRENDFYYGNPNNQFWNILSDLFNEKIINKKEFLLKHNIALFDVIESCSIIGSNDSSIKDVEVNDLKPILKNSKIKYIFTTGKCATNLYKKYLEKETNIESIYLPSTSPLYVSMKYNEKKEAYKIILKYLN